MRRRTDLKLNRGPAHGRPMPLQITQESEVVEQNLREYNGGVTRGKRVQLQRSKKSLLIYLLAKQM